MGTGRHTFVGQCCQPDIRFPRPVRRNGAMAKSTHPASEHHHQAGLITVRRRIIITKLPFSMI
jgi:hypothetical protein